MLNVEEIKQIVKIIETDPKHWNQGDWVVPENWAKPIKKELKINLDSIPDPTLREMFERDSQRTNTVQVYDESCNTRNCVAGWAVLRAGLSVRNGYVFDQDGNYVGFAPGVARDLLGLNERQAAFIFGGSRGRNYQTDEYDPQILKKDITYATGITFE